MGSRVHSTAASEDAYLDLSGEADDPSRALIRQILGAVAAYERSMIRLRMRSGKARKRELGGFIGGRVPYGFISVNATLVPDPSEQSTLAMMRQMRSRGSTLQAICDELHRRRVPTKHAGLWHPTSVARLLNAPGVATDIEDTNKARRAAPFT